MEEEKKEQDSIVEDLDNLNEEVHTIKMKRHYWPDEQEKIKLKKRLWHARKWSVTLIIIAILIGWILGTIWPIGGRYSSFLNQQLDSTDKINAVLSILENEWFFKDDIEDIDTTLSDEALYGMTDNEIDPHTSYMSKDELESFTQSINRNFVGIGVTFTSENGVHMVTSVYKGSPADEAGVEAGDIIHAVDGTVVDDLTSDEVKELVAGEEGTDVTIEFLRQGKSVTYVITRKEVSGTTYGEVQDDGIAWLKISNFGEGTGEEVKEFMNDFESAGCTKMILDLRDNGGGYLTALQTVASFFLNQNDVILTQVYADGSEEALKADSLKYDNIEEIVILINENTASAAEAMTLALKENRPDQVTIVGTTSYGKGTAQVTKNFDDGSALKYTTSKWVSPNGNWINNTGITPDVEVKLHDIFYASLTGMEDEETYAFDSVGTPIADVQLALDYLGYAPGRTDGYFSEGTLSALQSFENDEGIEVSDELDADLYNAIISAVSRKWNASKETDTQYQKAEEILNG